MRLSSGFLCLASRGFYEGVLDKGSVRVCTKVLQIAWRFTALGLGFKVRGLSHERSIGIEVEAA